MRSSCQCSDSGKGYRCQGETSDEKVKLTWNTAAGARGYQIYQKTGSEKYHRIKTTGKKSYTVSELTPGNTYYFRVRAYADSSGKKKYGKYSSSVKITVKNISVTEGKVVTVSPKSDTYKKKYMNTSWFTEQTHSYYVLRSYLEYFANIGGGELHLKKGTYNLQFPLYIPSNTTVIFEDGVTIKRQDKGTLFILCSYNDVNTEKKILRIQWCP